MAPEVARTKWNTKAPIEDLPREQQIIDGVATRATDYGLDAQVARDFFKGQIEASKIVRASTAAIAMLLISTSCGNERQW